MQRRSAVNVRVESPDLSVAEVVGTIDRDADWSGLAQVTTPRLQLELSGVKRITSHGVHAFMVGCRAVPPGTSVEWHRVAVPLVLQLGMIANFAGRASVTSFYAPYWCPACAEERRVLLTPGDVVGAAAPARSCERCQGALRFEELESDYLAWLEPAGA